MKRELIFVQYEVWKSCLYSLAGWVADAWALIGRWWPSLPMSIRGLGIIMVVLSLGQFYEDAWAAPETPPLNVLSGNLLINGDMDDPNYGFYWRPTNHYVAGMWFEWWVGDTVPEFIDGGIPYHNVCYPPPPRGHCYDYGLDYFNLSQGYIRWGWPYIAGIYQPVSGVTPCTLYKFEAYNRNDGVNYYPRVGIDVTGWQLPIPDWDNPPDNCPPTGYSRCPNPRLDSVNDFPPTMVWSPEFDHEAYTWAAGVVTAEAAATTISVWTYAAPDGSEMSMSTYWDATSLVQVPFPDHRLPAPDSGDASIFIQNLVMQSVLDELTVTWTTPEPASTQLWYDVTPLGKEPGQFDPEHALATPLDVTPKTEHAVVITGLSTGDYVRFVALSRRSTGAQCVTESSGLSVDSVQSFQMPLPDDRLAPDVWEPSGFIQNLSSQLILDELHIRWVTPKQASTQVWYNIYPAPLPITSTITIYLPHYVYLPMIVSGLEYDANYEWATPLNITPKTSHYVTIKGLQPDEGVGFVALSCHRADGSDPSGGYCVVEVSEPRYVKIPSVSVTKLYLPLITRAP